MHTQTLFTESRLHKMQQAFKWVVYTLLIINFVFYFLEDWDRATHILREGSTWLERSSEFATSIDEIAWFLLLFMFELETYTLSDEAWKGWVAHAVRGTRVFCYLLLAHTIVAYVVAVIDLHPTTPVQGVSDLCMLTDADVSYVKNLAYTVVDQQSCSDLSEDTRFFWVTESAVVTDAEGLALEKDLAWVDLIEAVVWLLIILAIEMVVRLHGHGVTRGPVIATGNAIKLFLYLVLLAAAVYWATLSHWLYFWDELLWIGGFAVIEMNVSEWSNDLEEEDRVIDASGGSGSQGDSYNFDRGNAGTDSS